MASFTTIVVLMLPGATALTVMPNGARSIAADFTNPITPHLAAT
jgi:hypothetical protein